MLFKKFIPNFLTQFNLIKRVLRQIQDFEWHLEIKKCLIRIENSWSVGFNLTLLRAVLPSETWPHTGAVKDFSASLSSWQIIQDKVLVHFLLSGLFLFRQEWLWAVFQEGAILEQLNAARLIQHWSNPSIPYCMSHRDQQLGGTENHSNIFPVHTENRLFYDNGSFLFPFRIFFLQLKFQSSSIFHISEKSLFIHRFKPNFSRRKRFQNFEKQLNNFTWGSDSNRKFCPVLIVAFLFVTVPIIAGIAGRIWLISMHFSSF